MDSNTAQEMLSELGIPKTDYSIFIGSVWPKIHQHILDLYTARSLERVQQFEDLLDFLFENGGELHPLEDSGGYFMVINRSLS